MHYTEGARLSAIAPFGTIDQHIDQNLPTTGGSTVSAEFLNALMFEVAQTIEYAGLTIEPNSTTDRTNGFDQLSTAIFESAAIDTAALTDAAVTNAKISEVSLNKLDNGKLDLEYTSGDYTYHLDLDGEDSTFRLAFTETNSSTNIEYQSLVKAEKMVVEYFDTSILRTYGILEHDQLLLRTYNASEVETGRAKLATDGLFFLDSNKSIKHHVIATGTSFALDPGPGDYILTVVTDIPDTAVVLMAQFTYVGTSTLRTQLGDPGSIEFTSSAGYLKAYIRYDTDPTSDISSDPYLMFFYSDS